MGRRVAAIERVPMSHRPIKPAALALLAKGDTRRVQNELYAWSSRRGTWIQADVRLFTRYARRFPGAPWRRVTYVDRSNGAHEIRTDDSRLPAVVVRTVGRNTTAIDAARS